MVSLEAVTEYQTPDPGPRTPDPGPRTPDAPGRLRGFWALFVTQFQGAFSDNVLKWLVVFMILGMNVSSAELHRVGELVTALFSLPFILFSMAGGFFADRFSKRTISVSVKIFEIGVMLLALAGFWLNQIPMLLGCVFLMGVHSSFFGPSKYGLLPELLPERKLSWGNGLIELGTFMAIILGTVAAARMSKHFHGHQAWSGIILIALAVIGFVTCLGITRVPAADPGRKFHANFLSDSVRAAPAGPPRPGAHPRLSRQYVFLLPGPVAAVECVFLRRANPAPGRNRHRPAEHCPRAGHRPGQRGGRLSFRRENRIRPRAARRVRHVAGFRLAVRAGFVRERRARPAVVARVHRRLFHRAHRGVVATPAGPGEERRGAGRREPAFVRRHFSRVRRVLFAGGRGGHVAAQHFSVRRRADAGGRHLRFVFAAGRAAAVSAVVRDPFALPDPHRSDATTFPAKGGALFVCNHVSLVDALLLIASTDRPVRFLMFKDIYEQPWMKPFARILGVIPISSEQRPREMIQSLQTASDAIRNGEVVCIFAEGQITRIGQLLPFRRGFERIMKDVDAPIIPVALDGVWGSLFSFHKGRFLWKLPRRIPYPVTVNFGQPLPPTATPFEVRSAVQELLVDAWQASQSANASAAHRLRPHGAPSSAPFRHGRRAKRPGQLRRGAGAIRFPRAPVAENLVGTEDGRHAAAAVGAGRAGQLRRAAAAARCR